MTEPRRDQRRPGSESGEFRAALARLERAVEDLVSTAGDELSGRASRILEEASRRLEREAARRGNGGSRGGYGGAHGGHRPRYPHGTGRAAGGYRRRRLYRDPRRRKLAGVCAGVARYYGMEPWVVRCIAVTGLLFFPTIVFPAYWIMYFVMDRPPRDDLDQEPGGLDRPGRDHRSPAPELGPRLSPRYSLRDVQSRFAEVELRLRRMETHVTSGGFELQRELNRIDGGSRSGRG